MAHTPAVQFNTDERVQKRSKQAITIEGRTFHPRKRTVNMMKDLAKIAPEAFGKEFNREENPTRELEVVNDQINALLVDDGGEAPGREFLDENLDIEDAYSLLDQLIPKMSTEEARVRD